MPSELVDLLDRQAAFARRQSDPADFLLAVVRFVAFLHSDPRLTIHVEDIQQEASVFADARRAHEEEVVPELVRLRGQLVRLVPESDDSTLAEPAFEESEQAWEFSLARFDRLAAGQPDRTNTITVGGGGMRDDNAPRHLIDILRSKVREAQFPDTAPGQGPNARPDLNELAARLRDLSDWQEYKHRQLLLARRGSAATALAGLEGVVREINPKPVPLALGDRALLAHAHRAIERSSAGWPIALSKALFDPSSIGDGDREALAAVVEQMRTFVDVIHEELRRRLGAVASRLALLDRFKLRCEWHDRERLHQLAHASDEPELTLTAELARFLFDQGLNPVTRMRVGGLEPDVFDPLPASSLYVEAKRYATSNGARAHIRAGLPQIHDTAGRLRGGPYEVDEVFYVVFRQGGPRYVLPDSVRGEDYVVYPVLIDVAPLTVSGSRSGARAIRIDAAELEPLLRDDDEQSSPQPD